MVTELPWTSGMHRLPAEWWEDPRRHRDIVDAFRRIAAEAITAPRLEDLLKLVGKQLCHLIGVRRCSVYLRRDDGKFQGIAGYCGRGDITPGVQRLVAGVDGDDFTLEIVKRRASVLIEDAQRDPRPVHRTMVRWGVRDMLGVPLIFAGDIIGIIFLDNEDEPHVYNGAEIQLAEMFASLASLFIRYAVVNVRLQEKAAQAARQAHVLEYLADVHAQLTRAVLQGADILQVVNLLSDLAKKPVVLYNERFEVMAWAVPPKMTFTRPPALSSRILRLPTVRQTVSRLSARQPSAIVPPKLAVGLGARHLLCLLMIEGKRSGYLDIVEIGRGLTDLDTKLAEHGATVLALQVLYERRQIEAAGQARDDFLSDLLRGVHDKAQLIRRGPQFGIDLAEPHVLVRVTFADDGPDLPATARRAMLTRAFTRTLGREEPPAVSVPGADIVLVRLPRGGEAAALRQLEGEVRHVVRSLVPRLSVRGAIVSGVCRSVDDFPLAHGEIREIAEFAHSLGWTEGVLLASDLGVLRLVISSERVQEALRFARDFLAPLREHDARGDGQLVATLRTFVGCQGNVRTTAETLGVHENTIRYRLTKIGNVARLDAHSFDTLLAARLAFQVLELARGSDGGADRPFGSLPRARTPE